VTGASPTSGCRESPFYERAPRQTLVRASPGAAAMHRHRDFADGSARVALFISPDTTNAITCRSRGVSGAYRSRNGARLLAPSLVDSKSQWQRHQNKKPLFCLHVVARSRGNRPMCPASVGAGRGAREKLCASLKTSWGHACRLSKGRRERACFREPHGHSNRPDRSPGTPQQ
jgi:hypothetical protein